MRIDLANIAGTPGARGRFPISEQLAPTEDFACVGPVTGELVVENTGSLLMARGKLRADLRLPCVRCLSEGEATIQTDVQEEFALGATAPDVSTIDRDEPEEAAVSDYILDAAEFVRQHVTASLPMAFLCRPDCQGLCPGCGRNLNEGPCECAAVPADSRWSKLADLLDGQTEDRGR